MRQGEGGKARPRDFPRVCAEGTADRRQGRLAGRFPPRYIWRMDSATSSLVFPHDLPPAPGHAIQITTGVLWFRLPLPYRLDHVNIYLLEDDDGWAVLDTGLGTSACRAAWDAILAGPLAGQRLTRMIVTHYHPDHVGLAGWLAERFGLSLSMPRPEYLYSLALQYAPGDLGADAFRPFYRRHGLSAEITDLVLGRGHEYLRRTTGVPTSYHRLQHGDTLHIGARDFQVQTGGGHALEQAMLVRPAEKLFFAADQVIARISPNVSVHAMEPDLDALGIYLRSLRALREAVPHEVLVLPGHGLPFYGLHARIAELITHHAQRCGLIAAACRERPLSVAELVPHVFHRELDEHQTGFAFGEVLAHVNHMLGGGELVLETDSGGTDRYRAR
ncbi:MAG TPA: MBL fold metallo-hydrolase [Acetobacteraceae bacterium]|nr:MBL fold metallo-hydrolase [Acetobacteraceae bacterium]